MTTLEKFGNILNRPREDENLEFKEAKKTNALPEIY